jgi:enterochelin esterase
VLILFDGQVWLEQMGIVPVLDALIDSGLLPPVHVAMIDSRDQGEYRAEHVGVPGGHVDLVIDRILPLLRSRFAVSPHGADTIVSGQSYGGIASLWALALADGEIGHAIAQSPSLWRFDVAEALAACPHWLTARILSGTFEGPMLMHARDLARALSGRDVRVTPVSGGHDWAWWSVRLLIELADLLHARPNSRSDVGRES